MSLSSSKNYQAYLAALFAVGVATRNKQKYSHELTRDFR